mmetsp:Transcript_10732/g.16376  ORF Transcript_10732/g.16376 Transcript_10732/m.16376 type:complete len:548 (+) Transcript_10732:504-2147(+)
MESVSGGVIAVDESEKEDYPSSECEMIHHYEWITKTEIDDKLRRIPSGVRKWSTDDDTRSESNMFLMLQAYRFAFNREFDEFCERCWSLLTEWYEHTTTTTDGRRLGRRTYGIRNINDCRCEDELVCSDVIDPTASACYRRRLTGSETTEVEDIEEDIEVRTQAWLDEYLKNIREVADSFMGVSMNCGSKTYTSGKLAPDFLGCYEHSTEDKLPFQYTPGSEEGLMTNSLCIEGCGQNSYDHAGLWNGNQCFCGYAVHLTTKTMPDSCTKVCEGDYYGNSVHNQMYGNQGSCGALERTSVYKVPEKDIVSPSAHSAYSYVGCYSNYVTGVQDKHSLQNEDMTIDMCVKECAANGYHFQLANIHDGDCTCTNVADLPNDAVSSTECSANCNGDSATKCGGQGVVSVYEVPELCLDKKSNGLTKNYLDPNEKLLTAGTLVSQNGKYTLNVRKDHLGRIVFVLGDADGSTWIFGTGIESTSRSTSAHLFMKSSGNLAIYDDGVSVWSSNTPNEGNFLLLDNDGSVILYGPNCVIRKQFPEVVEQATTRRY